MVARTPGMKKSNKLKKETARAVREITFHPCRKQEGAVSFCVWQFDALLCTLREERSANGQPLCLPCLTCVYLSTWDFRSSTCTVVHHLLNMPSSQPRSPPVVVVPLPRLPISGNNGAGLCSSFFCFVCSILVLDAGLSSTTASKSSSFIKNMPLLRLNQLPDLARGRICGVMV